MSGSAEKRRAKGKFAARLVDHTSGVSEEAARPQKRRVRKSKLPSAQDAKRFVRWVAYELNIRKKLRGDYDVENGSKTLSTAYDIMQAVQTYMGEEFKGLNADFRSAIVKYLDEEYASDDHNMADMLSEKSFTSSAVSEVIRPRSPLYHPDEEVTFDEIESRHLAANLETMRVGSTPIPSAEPAAPSSAIYSHFHPAPTSPEKKAMTRTWILSKPNVERVQSHFPEVHISLSQKHYHPHPIAALERICAEQVVYSRAREFVGGWIVDLNGNADRHLREDRTLIHSVCPIVTPEDNNRRAARTNKHPDWYCECPLLGCTCVVPDCYISINSLYYLTQIEILCLLHNSYGNVVDGVRYKKLYAVLHTFEQGYGGFHFNGVDFESKYEMKTPELVVMAVNGNTHQYQHDPLLWLLDGYFEYRGLAMSWSIEKRGDTRIVTFNNAPCGLPTNPASRLDMVQSLDRSDHYGEVKFRQDEGIRPMFNFLKVEHLTEARWFSFGPVLMTYTDHDSFVPIPKDVVDKIASKIIGKPRNASTRDECIRHARYLLNEKKVNMPSTMRTRAVIYAAAYAMIKYVADEIDAFSIACLPKWQRAFAKLHKVFNFEALVCPCGIKGFEEFEANERESVVRSGYYTARESLFVGVPVNMRHVFPRGGPDTNMERDLVAIRP